MNINWFRANIELINNYEKWSDESWESEFPQSEMTNEDFKDANFFGEMVPLKYARKEALNYKEKLKKSFVFNVPLNLSILLTKTKPDIIDKEIHLPYEVVYINSNIMQEDAFFIGGILCYKEKNGTVLKVSIRDMRLHDGHQIKEGMILKFFIRDGEKNFNTIIKESKETLTTKIPIEKKDLKNILSFFFNFVEFLNNPDIEFVKKEDSFPSNIIRNNSYGSFSIVVTGKLKIYLDRISEIDSISIIRAHWVRGHWMVFRSYRYTNMKGKKTWVYPYIRGFGNPNKKDYYLKQNKGVKLLK